MKNLKETIAVMEEKVKNSKQGMIIISVEEANVFLQALYVAHKVQVPDHDWTEVVSDNGKYAIAVPNELDALVKNFGMQFGFVLHADKDVTQACCHMVYRAQEFFAKLWNPQSQEQPAVPVSSEETANTTTPL